MKNSGPNLKLNLGCGQDKRESYINIDIVRKFRPDLVHDLLKPLPFKDNSVQEIIAQDILEHFIWQDLEKLLAEISRVLKPGGKLNIRVPDINNIIKKFAKDEETRNIFLYGDTSKSGIFGAHKIGFTKQQLINLLAFYSLKLINIKSQNTNFVASFKKIKNNNKLKNLLVIIQTFGMGGAEIFSSDLLLELQKKYNINIKIYTNHNNFINLLKNKNLKAFKINSELDIIGNYKGLIKALFLWPFFVAEYFKIIKNNQNTDLILLTGFAEKILVSIISKFLNIKTIWIEYGPNHNLLNKFFKLPKFFYYLAKNLPQKIIVPSENTKNYLTAFSHLSSAKLKVIPCGRNIKIIKNKKINPPAGGQKNLITCVSRLEPGKGQDLLIKAFKLVLKQIPDAKLKIIGEGDFKIKLKKLIKNLNLENQIILTGRVDNALLEMQAAHLCVFPSVWDLEGFGLVTIEAMALGKPIIAFDTGPTPEIIINNYNGLLAKNKDINHLAKQIIKLLKNKKLANQLAKQAKIDFEQKYKIAKIAALYILELNKAYVSDPRN